MTSKMCMACPPNRSRNFASHCLRSPVKSLIYKSWKVGDMLTTLAPFLNNSLMPESGNPKITTTTQMAWMSSSSSFPFSSSSPLDPPVTSLPLCSTSNCVYSFSSQTSFFSSSFSHVSRSLSSDYSSSSSKCFTLTFQSFFVWFSDKNKEQRQGDNRK